MGSQSKLTLTKESRFKFINHRHHLVNTITLKELLTISESPNYIDYISIDVEGVEYEILKEFPFEIYNFGIITVEHNYEREKRIALNLLLQANGYVRVLEDKSEYDDWYISKDIYNSQKNSF